MYYCPSFIPNVYKRHDVLIEGLVSALCDAPFYQHKKMLGEILYQLVDQLEHEHAAKVTGLILEMDTTEVLHLLESPTDLRLMVAETMDVLRGVLHDAAKEPMPIKDLASALVNTPTYRRRMILGENLYPLVNKLEHKHAYKVTEMILELDTAEVLYLLESPNELKLVVDEAMDVLRNAFVSALVNAPRYEHKMILAENIYSLVDQMEHTHVDKVTKMILELDTAEVLYLLESPDSLKLAVEEAINYVDAQSFGQVTEPTSNGRPENMVKDTNDMLHMVQESTLQDAEKRVSFATVVVTENTHKKVNFRKVEEDVASNVDYESTIPMSSVVKVNERLSNTIYGYFIGKRVVFPVVENYVYNARGKFGIQKVMMYAKGFYFFKFSSTKGVDDILENGPWMIRQVPIILNTWSPSTSLTKENHSSVPILVKMHDVAMAAFTDDGLSFIASKTRNPLMLDSYTSTMCNESWGRSSYACAMIEVHANVELKESILVAIPKLEGNGYTCETVTGEYEWKPPRCSTCKIFGHMLDQCPHPVKEMPIKKVEGEMDGFQLVKDHQVSKLIEVVFSLDKMASRSKQQGKQPIITANSFSALVDEDINEANIEDWKTVGLSKYVDLESKKKDLRQ
ncbi:polyadenylate-binding protein 2-like protein [Tanacetum coccineum]